MGNSSMSYNDEENGGDSILPGEESHHKKIVYKKKFG
jgi:hypothetical protein